MAQTVSYRKRFYYLLAAGLLAFMLAYVIAFSQTVNMKMQLNKLKDKINKVETAPETIATLEKRLNDINNRVGKDYSSNPEFQKNLLDQVSSYCTRYSLVLREFPQVHTWEKQDYQFITGYAKVEGSFIPLLRLLYKLETGRSCGRLVSVDFLSTEDRKAKKLRLTMSIYIQTIKQTGNANAKSN